MNNNSPPGLITFSIGSIALSLIPQDRSIHLEIPNTHKPFLSTTSPDINIYVRHEPEFDIDLDKLIFETGGNWLIGLLEEKIIIKTGLAENKIHRVLTLEQDLTSADLVCVGDMWLRSKNNIFPLGYPLDMLLVALTLVKQHGELFHAAAIEHRGRGILFVGNSGAGKSTISRLWKEVEGTTLLSDDRIIIRRTNGFYRIYGTPWHGDAQVFSQQSASLDCIFILNHAPRNHIVQIEPIDAIVQLLACSFSTYWDAAGMKHDLQFLDELVLSVPCYELNFVPDSSIVDFIKRLDGNLENLQ